MATHRRRGFGSPLLLSRPSVDVLVICFWTLLIILCSHDLAGDGNVVVRAAHVAARRQVSAQCVDTKDRSMNLYASANSTTHCQVPLNVVDFYTKFSVTPGHEVTVETDECTDATNITYVYVEYKGQKGYIISSVGWTNQYLTGCGAGNSKETAEATPPPKETSRCINTKDRNLGLYAEATHKTGCGRVLNSLNFYTELSVPGEWITFNVVGDDCWDTNPNDLGNRTYMYVKYGGQEGYILIGKNGENWVYGCGVGNKDEVVYPPGYAPQPSQTGSDTNSTVSPDCVGTWTEWGSCSASCGGGAQQREYKVTTPAGPDGTACNVSGNGVRACGMEPCPAATIAPAPLDCVGAWTEWGPCSVTCGAGGIKIRWFQVTQPAANGGAPCDNWGYARMPCTTGSGTENGTGAIQPCPTDSIFQGCEMTRALVHLANASYEKDPTASPSWERAQSPDVGALTELKLVKAANTSAGHLGFLAMARDQANTTTFCVVAAAGSPENNSTTISGAATARAGLADYVGLLHVTPIGINVQCLVSTQFYEPAADILWNIQEDLKANCAQSPVVFVGHGQGGAMASIAAMIYNMPDNLAPYPGDIGESPVPNTDALTGLNANRTQVAVYTFGEPPTLFSTEPICTQGIEKYRTVYEQDFIPGLPTAPFHWGKAFQLVNDEYDETNGPGFDTSQGTVIAVQTAFNFPNPMLSGTKESLPDLVDAMIAEHDIKNYVHFFDNLSDGAKAQCAAGVMSGAN